MYQRVQTIKSHAQTRGEGVAVDIEREGELIERESGDVLENQQFTVVISEFGERAEQVIEAAGSARCTRSFKGFGAIRARRSVLASFRSISPAQFIERGVPRRAYQPCQWIPDRRGLIGIELEQPKKRAVHGVLRPVGIALQGLHRAQQARREADVQLPRGVLIAGVCGHQQGGVGVRVHGSDNGLPGEDYFEGPEASGDFVGAADAGAKLCTRARTSLSRVLAF